MFIRYQFQKISETSEREREMRQWIVEETFYTPHKYNSESANNYFSSCLHLNGIDVLPFQFYELGHTHTHTYKAHSKRGSKAVHKQSATSAAKCSCFSFISAHFRFVVRRRRSTWCVGRFSPAFFFYFMSVLLLFWHRHRVYCISNCDAANIFSSVSHSHRSTSIFIASFLPRKKTNWYIFSGASRVVASTCCCFALQQSVHDDNPKEINYNIFWFREELLFP